MHRRAFLLLIAGLLALSACGGGDDSSTSAPPTSASTLTTAPSALTTTSTTEPVGDKFHVVAQGETLSAIAALYNLTIAEILDANPNIGDPSRIAINTQILIPQIDPAAETSTTLPPLELDPPTEPDLPEVQDAPSTTEPLATTSTTAGG
jgi:LysM repeat protein